MPHYRGTADRLDRTKALAGVILVHAALAAVILSGLDVRSVARTIESLKTFEVAEPPAPQPPPPPASLEPQRPREEAGDPGKRAEPSPIVVPQPRVLVPAASPVVAAPVAGTGSAARSGAAASGSGTGAGGFGSGRGGGGTGDYSRFTPARMLNKIPDREYRRISAGGLPQGRATITFRIEPDGTASACRVVRSSGERGVDGILCDAAMRHLRFSPARDPDGRPIAQDMTYTPVWWRPN